MNLLNVSVEMFLPAKSVIAEFTLKRFDVPVSHNVQLQFVKSVEFFGAAHVVFEGTFVLLDLAVYERVSLQLVISIELCPTLFTLVGQLARVDHHVGLEVVFILHLLLADSTLEHPLRVSH